MVDPIAEVVAILTADFPQVHVSTDMPMERPERAIMVALDGDASTPYLLLPRIGLTVWGTSDMDAKGLAFAAVDSLRDASLTHDWLSAVQLETVSRDEWSRNGQSRYFAALQLTFNTD